MEALLVTRTPNPSANWVTDSRPPDLGIETPQAQALQVGRCIDTQKVTEPLGRDVAHVPGLDYVVPPPPLDLPLGRLQRQVQGQHARGAKHQLAQLERGLDEGHARELALSDELAFLVHHHPGPVPGQAGGGQLGFGEGDTGTGFDRIHPDCVDSGLQLVGRWGRR